MGSSHNTGYTAQGNRRKQNGPNRDPEQVWQPKNIGAKIVQSWMELNVAPEAPTVAGKSSR